jgi:hypothetical protein
MSMRAFEREGLTTDLRDLDSLAKDTFIENTRVCDVTTEELFDVFFAPYVDKELGIEHDIGTTSVSPQRRLQILGIGKYVED